MSRAAQGLLFAVVAVPAALIFGAAMLSDVPTGKGGLPPLDHVQRPASLPSSVRLSGEPLDDVALQRPAPGPWWADVVAVFNCPNGSGLCGEPVTSEPRVLSIDEYAARRCAEYNGLQLTADRAVELVALYSWPGHTPAQMADTFERESSRFVGAVNRCTGDYGYTQVNYAHHSSRPECGDLELLQTDVLYNLRCAEAIYRAQGIRAWVAAEGVLWD